MPVYEYQCSECGKIEEAFQKISEAPLETCSFCKGHLKKLISQSSFHLKGSGWYVTDYGGTKTGTEVKSDDKKPTNEKKKVEEKKSIDSKISKTASCKAPAAEK
ncbi:MAG: zinc ribbon domain-containing protein [Pseudomonadota bacterium]